MNGLSDTIRTALECGYIGKPHDAICSCCGKLFLLHEDGVGLDRCYVGLCPECEAKQPEGTTFINNKENNRVTNCYDHTSGCYADVGEEKIASAIAGGKGDAFNNVLGKYFEKKKVIGDPSITMEPGDIVLWKGHSALATGNGDIVSQYGYPDEALELFGNYNELKNKSNRNADDEKALKIAQCKFLNWFDPPNGKDLKQNEASAQKLKDVAKLGNYEVYRIKDQFKSKFFTCNALRPVG